MTNHGDGTMITDDDLRALLDEAAEHIPVAPGGPERVLAAIRSTRPAEEVAAGEGGAPDAGSEGPRSRAGRQSGRTSRRRRVLAAAAAVVVLAAGLSFVFGQERTGPGSADSQTAAGSTSAPEPTAGTAGDAAGPEAGATATTVPASGGRGSSEPLVPGAASPAKLVKVAGIDLLVGEGKVPEAFDQLITLAVGAGGVVADQQTRELGDSPSGTITLRVPAAAFEDTLARARQLGEVGSATTSGQDVTAEYTDIEGRLKTLNDERDQLRLLFGRANETGDINDILTVRDRITSVQTEIEQLTGRQRVLDDQVSLSTLTVSVRERPAGGGPILDDARRQSGFAGAWHDATGGFNRGLQSLIAGSGKTLLVLLCIAAAALLGRSLWRYGRRRLV